jgi:hypothetical protein
MNLRASNQQFGVSWLFFGYTLALHVLDEAGNNFLSVYNPNALAIRRILPFLPIPIFTFQTWIGSLSLALVLWLALTPLAFRGLKGLRWLAIPVAVLAGIGNALGHLLSSIYFGRFMPGVYSAPLILLAGIGLLKSAVAKDRATPAGSV